MNAIKLQLVIESETLKIPELKYFIGKKVELTLTEKNDPKSNDTEKYKKLKSLRGRISFDKKVLQDLRENSIL